LAADAGPALAALGAIAPSEWLTVPSRTLLERVIAASSKDALDEAAKSDVRAQALVGSGYFFGAGGYPPNVTEAIKFYRLAAASNVVAQINLASLLIDGRANSGQPAPEAAVQLFEKAAAQGHRAAQFNLGESFLLGRGVPADEEKAKRFLRLAADQGLADAQVDLAWLQTAAAEREAEALFRAAAAQNDADGLAALAWFLDTGSAEESIYVETLKALDGYCSDGQASSAATRECDSHQRKMLALSAEAKDAFGKAFKAFANRAAAGEAYAMRRYGDLQYDGIESIAPARAAAFKSYASAAAAGDEPAKLMLAVMQEIGDGVAKNAAEAERLLKELVSQPGGFHPDFRFSGLDQATLLRAIMEDKGLGVARNEAHAAELYGQIELFSTYARVRLARMTELGLGGLAADRDKAVELYKIPALDGVEDAREALKRLGESTD
jgi:TPR repeat protein